jgi:hypothetical protein
MLERSRNRDCLSDLRLDSLLAGELDGAAEADARQHLASCPLCSARRAELEGDRDRFRATARPPLGRPAAQSAPAPGRARRAQRWLWPAAAAAAVVAVLVFWPRQTIDHGGSTASRPSSGGATRIKGRERLDFYVKRGTRVSAGASGDPVHPGDEVRFATTTDRPRYLVVGSVDGGGAVSIYFPDGPSAGAIEAGADRPLPGGIVLDAVLGTERVYGFFCQRAVDVAAVRATLAARGRDPDLPGCMVDRLVLEKSAR